MRSRVTPPIVLTLALSLTSCELRQTPPIAAAPARAAEPAARKAEIRQALAPRCGTPTDWTATQKRAVADFIDAHADEWALELLAGEWRRETNAIRICRGAQG
ncbi:MAG: hypothetical protein QM651_13655 [Rhodoblastus sp.]